MAGILYWEQIKPGEWGLHDLSNFVLADLNELESILEQTPQGRSVKQYLFNGENEKVQGSALINLQANFFNLEVAATHQYYTPKEQWFSIKDFLKGEGILLVGQDISARASSNPITQAIIKTLINKINLRPDRLSHESPDIFFYLDEFPFLGRLPGIEEVLTFQRSKGVSAYLSAQDLNQLQETYGNHLAHTITNNCDIKIFCRTNCNLTADWSVKLFGERRVWEESQSFTESPTSRSITYNRQRTQRTKYTTDTFLNLPNADKTNGIHFHFLSPYTRNYTSYCVLDPEKVEQLKPQTLNILSLIRKHPKYSQMPTLEAQAREWAVQKVNENIHNPDWVEQYLNVKTSSEKSLRSDILHFVQAEIKRIFGDLLPPLA